MPVGSATDSTAAAQAAAQQTQYVTIKQPDGTTYRIPQAKATWDPATQSWVSSASQEAMDTAKQVNSKYNQQMDGDMFLKLLTAQLKYQDPSKPMDTGQMMQQTASLAMVQRINEMSTNVDNMVKATQSLADTEKEMATSFVSMLMEQRMNSGVGLVGRTVTYADAENPETKITGVVESVRFDKTGPILSVDGKDVPLTAVVSVQSVTSPLRLRPRPTAPARRTPLRRPARPTPPPRPLPPPTPRRATRAPPGRPPTPRAPPPPRRAASDAFDGAPRRCPQGGVEAMSRMTTRPRHG